jgi:hypothetical protein
MLCSINATVFCHIGALEMSEIYYIFFVCLQNCICQIRGMSDMKELGHTSVLIRHIFLNASYS